MKRLRSPLLSACLLSACLLSAGALAATPPTPAPAANPTYTRMNNSWMGFWPHGNEHLQFQVTGDEVMRKDAWHFSLRPGLNMMLGFVDKHSFLPAKARHKRKADLLKAHLKWQLDNMRKEFGKIQSRNRKDLVGSRRDVQATEIIVHGNKRRTMRVYLIALATHDGVYMFAITPADKAEDDYFAQSLIASLDLIPRPMAPSPPPGKP